MPNFMRRFLDLAYPKGPEHEPKEDGSMSAFRDATAENINTIRTDVKNTAFIRTPDKTPLLPDLEREYGKTVDENLTVSDRIKLLKVDRYKKATTANDDDLQALLDTAGFDLNVYNNSPDGPAVDPDLFLDSLFQMQAQDTNYFAGNDDAYAGFIGGNFLVNERRSSIAYAIPTDPDLWPFIFFVGGDATFAGDGSLLTIDQGSVPNEQRKQLENIILKFKPLFTWCGLIVTFT